MSMFAGELVSPTLGAKAVLIYSQVSMENLAAHVLLNLMSERVTAKFKMLLGAIPADRIQQPPDATLF